MVIGCKRDKEARILEVRSISVLDEYSVACFWPTVKLGKTKLGMFPLSFSAGSSKIKIRSSSQYSNAKFAFGTVTKSEF